MLRFGITWRLGRAAGLSPHPLFDPDYFGGQHAASIGPRDPLVLYLAKRSSRSASPHPLFDLEAYVERVPGGDTPSARPGGSLHRRRRRGRGAAE